MLFVDVIRVEFGEKAERRARRVAHYIFMMGFF